MKIGIIGAGKMGYTLGKHFSLNCSDKIQLIGYYSKNIISAIDAAEFTNSNYFNSVEELVALSDILFITVPDGEITNVVRLIKECSKEVDGKIICHTSGAMSSADMKEILPDAFMYSVHPIYAVNSKKDAYVNFGDAFITIEGDSEYINVLQELFLGLGHKTKFISPKDKVKYHSAAVFSSNLVIGLYHMAEELLKQCGFNEDEVSDAIKPLFINNAKKLYGSNCEEALTGPVERCDIETVEKHLNVLQNEYFDVYKLLSKELIKIAEHKNKKNDYRELTEMLDFNNSF